MELEINASALEFYVMTTALRVVAWEPGNKTPAGYKITPQNVLGTLQMQHKSFAEISTKSILEYFQTHPEYFKKEGDDFILVTTDDNPNHIAIGDTFSKLVDKAENQI